MRCPYCGEQDTKVIDSRLAAEGGQIRRRRECQNAACRERFTTFESPELVMPRMIKNNGTRQPFDEDKLRNGLQRAIEKRPVSVESLDLLISRIKYKLLRMGEREIDTRVVGEMVMQELRDLDDVAYVRFASVYREFQDLDEFRAEIDRIDRSYDGVKPT